jgi:hypothetical protein
MLLRGLNATTAKPVLDAWKRHRRWVRSIELRDAWEPQELEINGRSGVNYRKGKHKAELADLILLLHDCGGQVIHLMLHRQPERIEEDLTEWASRWSTKSKERPKS